MVKRVLKIIWAYNHRAKQVNEKDYQILINNKVKIRVADYFAFKNKLEDLKGEYDYLALVYQIEDIFKIKWLSADSIKQGITKTKWQNRPYIKGFLGRL